VLATGWIALQGGEEDLHEGIAWFLLGLIGVHVAAVIATSILSRENLVRAMVTGRKNTADHPEIRRVRTASPAAFMAALAVSGAAIVGIRSIDPQAFSLEPREGAEREAGEVREGVHELKNGEASKYEGERDRD
jgi:hypothetical protein